MYDIMVYEGTLYVPHRVTMSLFSVSRMCRCTVCGVGPVLFTLCTMSSMLHCAKNWIYAIGYFAYISSLRIKNPTCGMNQFRTVHMSSILNRITCA